MFGKLSILAVSLPVILALLDTLQGLLLRGGEQVAGFAPVIQFLSVSFSGRKAGRGLWTALARPGKLVRRWMSRRDGQVPIHHGYYW
ncbi:MAG: hypothetical protein ACLSE4_12965 [Clostridium sp.]